MIPTSTSNPPQQQHRHVKPHELSVPELKLLSRALHLCYQALVGQKMLVSRPAVDVNVIIGAARRAGDENDAEFREYSSSPLPISSSQHISTVNSSVVVGGQHLLRIAPIFQTSSGVRGTYTSATATVKNVMNATNLVLDDVGLLSLLFAKQHSIHQLVSDQFKMCSPYELEVQQQLLQGKVSPAQEALIALKALVEFFHFVTSEFVVHAESIDAAIIALKKDLALVATDIANTEAELQFQKVHCGSVISQTLSKVYHSKVVIPRTPRRYSNDQLSSAQYAELKPYRDAVVELRRKQDALKAHLKLIYVLQRLLHGCAQPSSRKNDGRSVAAQQRDILPRTFSTIGNFGESPNVDHLISSANVLQVLRQTSHRIKDAVTDSMTPLGAALTNEDLVPRFKGKVDDINQDFDSQVGDSVAGDGPIADTNTMHSKTGLNATPKQPTTSHHQQTTTVQDGMTNNKSTASTPRVSARSSNNNTPRSRTATQQQQQQQPFGQNHHHHPHNHEEESFEAGRGGPVPVKINLVPPVITKLQELLIYAECGLTAAEDDLRRCSMKVKQQAAISEENSQVERLHQQDVRNKFQCERALRHQDNVNWSVLHGKGGGAFPFIAADGGGKRQQQPQGAAFSEFAVSQHQHHQQLLSPKGKTGGIHSPLVASSFPAQTQDEMEMFLQHYCS